jgi:hypothetical protein
MLEIPSQINDAITEQLAYPSDVIHKKSKRNPSKNQGERFFKGIIESVKLKELLKEYSFSKKTTK